MPGSRRLPARLLLAAVAWATSLAGAQQVAGIERFGAPYVEAHGLALQLGDVVTVMDGVLTWRGSEGVATFFLGTAEALTQRPGDGGPSEWALSAPVVVEGGSWYLPLDALQLLGVAVEEIPAEGARSITLHGPNGVSYRVAFLAPEPAGAAAAPPGVAAPDEGGWELDSLAGVPVLRFFLAGQLSLLLLDLDLAPLAFPELTEVIDAAAAAAGSDHALLLVVAALVESEWQASISFAQDGKELEVRHPYRLRLHLGSEATVGPAAPAAGVVLLPSTFSLYRPMQVQWAGVRGTVTFRH